MNPASEAEPKGVVTVTDPLLPAATTASMVDEEITAKDDAGVPPKSTLVAPVKLVPVMVTIAPEMAVVGVNEVIDGAIPNVNPARVAVPSGVVTDTAPDAPAPTTASMELADTTVKEVAGVPPKSTAVAPVKLKPVRVTVVPVPAVVGVNEVIEGPLPKVNPPSEAVPKGVVTETAPVAPAPTIASMVLAEITTNEVAAVPPKSTAVAPVKLKPEMVTVVPVAATVGVKDVMAGISPNVNPAREAVPAGVVTLTVPDAPAPTTASILVGELTVNEVAAVPPKLTAVVPVKFVPVIATVVPVPAAVGVKEVIVGGRRKVKPGKVAVPNEVVTETSPEDPAPTTASMVLGEMTTKDAAGVPPKSTAVAPAKLRPVMVTVAPAGAANGANPLMAGVNP